MAFAYNKPNERRNSPCAFFLSSTREDSWTAGLSTQTGAKGPVCLSARSKNARELNCAGETEAIGGYKCLRNQGNQGRVRSALADSQNDLTARSESGRGRGDHRSRGPAHLRIRAKNPGF